MHYVRTIFDWWHEKVQVEIIEYMKQVLEDYSALAALWIQGWRCQDESKQTDASCLEDEDEQGTKIDPNWRFLLLAKCPKCWYNYELRRVKRFQKVATEANFGDEQIETFINAVIIQSET